MHIELSKNSGILYYKYKGYYRLVPLGVCDANYFLCYLISVHMALSTNDSDILDNLEMGIRPLPFFLLGDEIFPWRPWLLRQYAGRILPRDERVYNYRYSRAQKNIENRFGILAARWSIFLTRIRALMENVEIYVCAYMALQNYL